MSSETQTQKCERCNAEGLRDNEDCPYYGEPDGCNSPIYGKFPTDEKSSVIGNAARLREALVKIEKMAHCNLCNVYPKYRDLFNNKIGGIEREARAALAASPRQCDVGTAEEQYDRFVDFCWTHRTISLGGRTSCNRCPLKGRGVCQLAWAQTPYEAKKGGAK